MHPGQPISCPAVENLPASHLYQADGRSATGFLIYSLNITNILENEQTPIRNSGPSSHPAAQNNSQREAIAGTASFVDIYSQAHSVLCFPLFIALQLTVAHPCPSSRSPSILVHNK